jgi:hypothetical protein
MPGTPKKIRHQFESDCKQLNAKVVPDIFADDPLNSSTGDATALIALLLSSSNLILNLFSILKSYKDENGFKIEYEKNGVKISFDNHTPIEEVKSKIKELENIHSNEQ